MSNAPEKPKTENEAPVVKSKKKLIIIIVAVLMLGIASAGAALIFSKKKNVSKETAEKPAKAPVFFPLDQFVVNLQSNDGDKYLQIQITLQVSDEAEINLIKANNPQIRSRLLMLLSSKNADEILTPAGKEKLIKEVKAQINLPFIPKGEPQKVSNVFFTSFIVQ